MATGIASKILKTAAEGAVGAAGGQLFEKGLSVLMGGSDTEKIQNSIDKVLQDVAEVKKIVTEMSQKLDAGIQQLRTDTLRTSLTSVGTIYDGVETCLKDAIKAKKESTSDEALKVKLASLQTSLDEKLKDCVKTLPGLLDQINSFLVDGTFVKGAANLAYTGSKDFLSYYLKMKTAFMQYWVRVVQGVFLLQMAQQSKAVTWPEGAEVISAHTKKLEDQEEFFRNTVGRDTCALGELILNGKKEIAFSSSWGEGFKLMGWNPTRMRNYSVPFAQGSDRQKWLLAVDSPPTTWDIDRNYAFLLTDAGSGFPLRDERVSNRYTICEGGWTIDAKALWLLKTQFVGSSKFYLSPFNDSGMFCFVEFTHNILEVRDSRDEKNDRSYLSLTPW